MAQGLIAVCQMTATNDKLKNFETVKRLVHEAKEAKAIVAFLPEACDFFGSSREETFSLAEPIGGPLVQAYKELARNNGIWLSFGGLHEFTGTEKLKNTHIIINDEGEIVGYYNKTHLFDVDIPSQNVKLLESSFIERGQTVPEPVETPVGKIGLSICYDVRFPELSLALARMGADILTYPSAFTFSTGASHWEVLLRAKAIETQCFVVAAAQIGMHNKKRSSWGHGMVIDPWGNVIAQCSDVEGIVTAPINLEYLHKVRSTMPLLKHRRYDLYPAMAVRIAGAGTRTQSVYDFGHVKIPMETVFLQTDKTFAFTNKRCVVPGHVLVAPIRPVQRLSELTPDEICDLFLVTQKVSKAMESIQQATSCTIVVQDGPDAGQTIKHVHVHVLPRKRGDFADNDDIYGELQKHDKDPSRPYRTEEEMNEEAAMIRDMLK
ncbi:UNVERIFIED_CONTAM: hypothetical protein PYX00_001066 [Menopon gallinae]|uniref:Nitrilase and fragile histidine triad fusion protein NitFhit n=1 Tax=Menopon gallinae TaxID=328185 RepID=A0AAW2IDE9_9NEOP